MLQGTPINKTSGWIKFTPSKYFQLDIRAKKKEIQVVDLPEKADIPKVPAIKTREVGVAIEQRNIGTLRTLSRKEL